jgi:hypothetical protein
VPITVEKWSHTDLGFDCQAAPDDSFAVRLRAVFVGPSGRALSIPGFYDGESRWVVRFSPDEEGRWSYQTRSDLDALDALSGDVLCITPTSPYNRGALEVDPEHPQHFRYQDGSGYFLIGYEADWLFALDLASGGALGRTDQLLDDIAASGFNQVVMNVYANRALWEEEGRGSEHDYGSPSLWPFGGSNEEPDYEALNVVFFRHLDSVITALRERGLLAHLMIYVWNKDVAWPPQRSTADDRYLEYVVARYQGFRNVIWDVAKEALSHGYCDADYVRDRAARIRRADAYNRLLTVHDHAYCRQYPQTIDFYSIQTWRTELYREMRELRETYKMPVLNIEHGGYERSPYLTFPGNYQDPLVCLDRNYQCIFAGTYSTYYWQSSAWDIVITDIASLPEDKRPRYDYFRHMATYFAGLDYHLLEPIEGGASSGFCLAEVGRRYLYYKPRGTYAFSTRLPEGFTRFRTEWFDPLTGEREDLGVLEGERSRKFRSPWGDEMALLRLERVN